MNCLNRILMQQYIDHEIDEEMAAKITEHLKNCPICRKEVDNLLKFTRLIKTATPEIAIPQFVAKKQLKAKSFNFKIIAVAAAVIALMFIIKPSKNEENSTIAPLIMESEACNYDPNTLYNSGTIIVSKTEITEISPEKSSDQLSDPNSSYNRAEIEIRIIN